MAVAVLIGTVRSLIRLRRTARMERSRGMNPAARIGLALALGVLISIPRDLKSLATSVRPPGETIRFPSKMRNC